MSHYTHPPFPVVFNLPTSRCDAIISLLCPTSPPITSLSSPTPKNTGRSTAFPLHKCWKHSTTPIPMRGSSPGVTLPRKPLAHTGCMFTTTGHCHSMARRMKCMPLLILLAIQKRKRILTRFVRKYMKLV